MPKASVIIAVYNRLDFLKLVLAGLQIQTETDFEVLIADDGSGTDFTTGLQDLLPSLPFPVRHLWHDDAGFRKNIILNQAITESQSPYLIFLDGDCIPHPEFVREHLLASGSGICLAGRRVDLSGRVTQQLSPSKIRNGYLQQAGTTAMLLVDFLRARCFHFMNGLYTRNPLLRRYFNRKERGLLGANFSACKADLLAINGFDERYTAPTFGEDSDIELRLRLAGVQIKPVLNTAVVYHCHHALLSRKNNSYDLYQQAVVENTAFTPYGIKKVSSESN
ncbi:MAG: glycosyltransferase [Sphingobacteriales bacterium]|nr:MAG: glycosyltransferase [Sphingobacteriales bacterium]